VSGSDAETQDPALCLFLSDYIARVCSFFGLSGPYRPVPLGLSHSELGKPIRA